MDSTKIEQPVKYVINPESFDFTADDTYESTEIRDASNFYDWWGEWEEVPETNKTLKSIKLRSYEDGEQLIESRGDVAESISRALAWRKELHPDANVYEVIGMLLKSKDTGEVVETYLEVRSYVENKWGATDTSERSGKKIEEKLDKAYDSGLWGIVCIESHYLIISRRVKGVGLRRGPRGKAQA